MRFLIGLILLAFPLLEIFILLSLGQRYGWWVIVYLVVVGFLGLQLIRDEKQLISAKMMQNLRTSASPMKAVLGSARNIFAGILLLIPGVITDIIAVVLLLIPMQQASVNTDGNVDGAYGSDFETHFGREHTNTANDDVIEGEYTEIKEDEPDKK